MKSSDIDLNLQKRIEMLEILYGINERDAHLNAAFANREFETVLDAVKTNYGDRYIAFQSKQVDKDSTSKSIPILYVQVESDKGHFFDMYSDPKLSGFSLVEFYGAKNILIGNNEEFRARFYLELTKDLESVEKIILGKKIRGISGFVELN